MTAEDHGLMEPRLSPKIDVVVLAGGRSVRMGSDKAMLPDVSGACSSLLDRAVGIARQIAAILERSDCVVYVSGAYGSYQCIADLIPGAGPLSGIHAGLTEFLQQSHSDPHYLLFIPVDMPALEASTLLTLINNARGASAVRFRNYELPALIRVTKDNLELLNSLLHRDPALKRGPALRDFFNAAGAFSVEDGSLPEFEFINVNTLSEFARWRAGAHI